jgi:4-alpha-glucanotransferase
VKSKLSVSYLHWTSIYHDSLPVTVFVVVVSRANLFQVFKYLPAAKETDISWALITAALSSVARTSMVTMQDILGLDSSARMNTPATQVIYCKTLCF